MIYGSAQLSKRPIIVWFPTINSENFLKRSSHEIPSEWVGKGFVSRPSHEIRGISIVNKKGVLTDETIQVLKAIKENNCILATGHVSWQEAKLLVESALKMGINKIIVTHPIYQLIDMPVEIQKELVQGKGVYLEHNFAMYLIDKVPIEKIAEQIKYVGADNCILSSDMGQINSPAPSEALKKFTELLNQEGITEEELKIMGEQNPRKLIGEL